MQTCNIMGVNIAVTDMEKTLRLVEDNCEAWRGKYICVANVHTTVTVSYTHLTLPTNSRV